MSEKEVKKGNNESDETPEVFAAKQGKQGWEFSRREFIATVGISAGVIASGCVVPSTLIQKSTATPTSTGTPTNTLTPANTMTPTSTKTPLPSQTPTARPTIEESLCRDPHAHRKEITNLLISKNGAWLVSAGLDHLIKVWSLPSVELLGTVSFTGAITKMEISPDSSMLAVLDALLSIHVYSLPDCKLMYDTEEGIDAFAFSPDGEHIVTGFLGDTINFYLSKNGDLFDQIEINRLDARDIAISSDGMLMASTGMFEDVYLYGYPKFTVVDQITLNAIADVVQFSPDGQYLFISTMDKYVYQWRIKDDTSENKFYSDGGFALSQDGSFLVFAEDQALINIWSIKDNASFKYIESSIGKITSLAINPDNTILVAGNDNGTMYLWSLPVGTLFSCPLDLDATSDELEGITYQTTASNGDVLTYTLPCGAPVPDGAVCVCNCVSGSVCSCVGYTACSCVGYVSCSCDTNCGCVGNVVQGSHYWYPD